MSSVPGPAWANSAESWGTSSGPGSGKNRFNRVEVLMSDEELEALNVLCRAKCANRSEMFRLILETYTAAAIEKDLI